MGQGLLGIYTNFHPPEEGEDPEVCPPDVQHPGPVCTAPGGGVGQGTGGNWELVLVSNVLLIPDRMHQLLLGQRCLPPGRLFPYQRAVTPCRLAHPLASLLPCHLQWPRWTWSGSPPTSAISPYSTCGRWAQPKVILLKILRDKIVVWCSVSVNPKSLVWLSIFVGHFLFRCPVICEQIERNSAS